MRNSKILKVAICSALVASLTAVTAISVSASAGSDKITSEGHTVGVSGTFTNWEAGKDIPMSDDDGDGIWEAMIDIPSVEADWITDWNKDDKPTGEQHFQFKVRLDNSWDVNWATYEPEHVRVLDSQCNLAIKEDVQAGDHIKFRVFLDTNQMNPDAVADPNAELDPSEVEWEFLYAGYDQFEKVTDEAPAESTPAESTPAETPAESTPAETPAESTPAETPADTTTDPDTTTPATGDTTSAIALVAVVLASLGTAVVMTKKASSKD